MHPHTNVLGINFFINFSFSLCFNSNWCSEFLFMKNYWNFVVYRYCKSWRHAYSISVLWGILCSCLKSFHACHAFILWNIRTWMRMLVGCKLKGQKKKQYWLLWGNDVTCASSKFTLSWKCDYSICEFLKNHKW